MDVNGSAVSVEHDIERNADPTAFFYDRLLPALGESCSEAMPIPEGA